MGVLTGKELGNLYQELVDKYHLISIEDPYDQDDWASYKDLTTSMGDSVQIVGDDLLVTNPKRVQKAIDDKACNALLLKVNQIGSVTESIEACKMMSHRSGETEDTFIA